MQPCCDRMDFFCEAPCHLPYLCDVSRRSKKLTQHHKDVGHFVGRIMTWTTSIASIGAFAGALVAGAVTYIAPMPGSTQACELAVTGYDPYGCMLTNGLAWMITAAVISALSAGWAGMVAWRHSSYSS